MPHSQTVKEIWAIYSTFPSRDEAISVAQGLVEKQLVACVNIVDGMTSVYRWEGALQQEAEVVLIAKTSAKKVDAAIAAIKTVHSYQVPAITAWPIEKGYGPFLEWVATETA